SVSRSVSSRRSSRFAARGSCQMRARASLPTSWSASSCSASPGGTGSRTRRHSPRRRCTEPLRLRRARAPLFLQQVALLVLLARSAWAGIVAAHPVSGANDRRGLVLPHGTALSARRGRRLALRLDGRLRPPLREAEQGGGGACARRVDPARS